MQHRLLNFMYPDALSSLLTFEYPYDSDASHSVAVDICYDLIRAAGWLSPQRVGGMEAWNQELSVYGDAALSKLYKRCTASAGITLPRIMSKFTKEIADTAIDTDLPE
jgi:hypothetical protein